MRLEKLLPNKKNIFICVSSFFFFFFVVIFLMSACACFHGQPLQFCICVTFLSFVFSFGLTKLINTLKRSLEALPAQNTEHFN